MTAKIPPKPAKDVIYVDVDDEITGIIDKVGNADQKVVALVLPKRAASLQSIVNMKLLKRSAEQAGKNVVLITNEQALMPLAGAAGLHVAKNLQSKPDIPMAPAGAIAAGAAAAKLHDEPEEVADDEDDSDAAEELPGKIDYDKPIGALAIAHEAENPETIDLDDEDEPAKKSKPAKTSKGAKVSVPNFDRFRMLLGAGALALVALIVFIFLAIFVLPKAQVTIETSSEPVTATFNLTASPTATAPDSKKGVLPSKLETQDQTGTQQVTATGQQNNGQKASGTITFSIPCSSISGSPPTIPGGTGVSTNGLSYITQSGASLTTPHFSPCRFTGSTTFKAISPGSKFNVGDSTFTISGNYPDVTASGSASGGTDDIVTVLSQSDIDGAKAKLTSGTTADNFANTFKQKLESQGAYVLASTLKAGDPQITANPSVGQPASTATVNIKVTYSVLTVKKAELSQVIEDKVSDQVDKTKQKLNGNFLNDANITVQSQSAPNTAVLVVNEDTTAVPIINVTAVKTAAKGHKAGDIQAAINNWPGVKKVDVKLSPFWVSKAPKKDSKITVVLKEVKTTNSSAP
ncbi:hypothetical protein KW792_00740 [Candidatus Saccharibacteria bacterium]|nr:hypothetical protein [Candidatus Saccharibacteria bacterium]